MAGSSDLSLWGRFTPEQVEEMRGRFAVQARFPGLIADQLGEVRTVLTGIPGVPPEVFAQIDIILTNCRAAHDNSRALWALLGTAQFLPLGEGELMAGNMVFHTGLPMTLDEAKAFRDVALDVGCAMGDGVRVFDAIVTLLNADEVKPLEIEAFIRLAGRGLRAVHETSGDTLSTLYDRLVQSVDDIEADIPRIEEHERKRAEAMAKEKADAA